MSRVVASMSVSLDGIYAGPIDPNADSVEEMFAGSEGVAFSRVTRWMHDQRAWRERQYLDGGRDTDLSDAIDRRFTGTGAYVLGRRMADAGLVGWGDEPPFHAPLFVVTHRPSDPIVKGDTTFTYVPDVETAIAMAKDAAGEKDVTVQGGGTILRQALYSGLVDELHLQTVPTVIGHGLSIFDPGDIAPGHALELKPTAVRWKESVLDVQYEVLGVRPLGSQVAP